MDTEFVFDGKKNIDGIDGATNNHKADMACRMLLKNTGGELRPAFTDVTDAFEYLLHLCDRSKFDVDAVLKTALDNWSEER